MVWWPFIVLAILLLLLFYPVTLRADLIYGEGDWQGIVTLHPFFGLKKPRLTLWDSEAEPKEEPKSKKKKGKKEEKIEAEVEKEVKKSEKKLPPKDIILSFVDIIKDAGKGIKRLRVNLYFSYALEDPAVMGYVTGAVYTAAGIVMGDQRKTRWRLGIYPNWQYFQTMVHCKVKITLCIFDIFYAFGGILIRTVKVLLQIIRRK